MFSFLYKNRMPINPKMREYCIKSTNDSIRKITEKYNEERKINKNNFNSLIVITKDDSPNPNPNDNEFVLSIICLLSSTTILYYFYKASRLNMFSFNRYIDESTK
jgi:hypothetical protein